MNTKKAIPKIDINTDYIYSNAIIKPTESLVFKCGLSYNYKINTVGNFDVYVKEKCWSFSPLEFKNYFMNVKEARNIKLDKILYDNK